MTDDDRDRCMAVLTSVHKLHNWRHVATQRGIWHDGYSVWVKFRGQLSTYDGDELTRLVIAAHQHHVRVGLHPEMGHFVMQLTPRTPPPGHLFERHPGMERFAA